jgi:hypothetical protein
MSFVVHFEDETTTVVDAADSYEQEGPLTTFFDRNGGGRLASAFAVRVASFRTSKIVEVRRETAEKIDALQSSMRSSSSTTTSHRCAHSPHRYTTLSPGSKSSSGPIGCARYAVPPHSMQSMRSAIGTSRR